MRSELTALQKELLFQVALTGRRGYRPAPGKTWKSVHWRLYTLRRRELVFCPGLRLPWYITEWGAEHLDKEELAGLTFSKSQPDYDSALDRLDPQRVPPALHRLAGAWELVHRLGAEIAYYSGKQTQTEGLSAVETKHLQNMLVLLPEASSLWREEVNEWLKRAPGGGHG